MHSGQTSSSNSPDPILTDADQIITEAAGRDTGVRPEIAAAHRELAGMLLAQESLQATLMRIATLARELVGGADDVSVTMIESKRNRSVAFAGDINLAYVLDERQYEDGYGPCIDAALASATISIDDTGQSELYPDFAALAFSHGVRSTLSVGFPTMYSISGALNIYSRGEGGFTSDARAVAHGFASYAAVSVTNATMYHQAVQQAAQLTEAMRSRAAIEQAKGMIMQSQRCGPGEAFRILRETSMRSNRKLHDIALTLVGKYPDR